MHTALLEGGGKAEWLVHVLAIQYCWNLASHEIRTSNYQSSNWGEHFKGFFPLKFSEHITLQWSHHSHNEYLYTSKGRLYISIFIWFVKVQSEKKMKIILFLHTKYRQHATDPFPLSRQDQWNSLPVSHGAMDHCRAVLSLVVLAAILHQHIQSKDQSAQRQKGRLLDW